jgi:hypothetical protein
MDPFSLVRLIGHVTAERHVVTRKISRCPSVLNSKRTAPAPMISGQIHFRLDAADFVKKVVPFPEPDQFLRHIAEAL